MLRPMARCFIALTLPELEEPPKPKTTSHKGRSRTTSLPPKPEARRKASSSSIASTRSVEFPNSQSSHTSTPRRPPSLKEANARHTSSPGEKRASRPPTIRRSTLGLPGRPEEPPSSTVPFFLSPIRKPSTHPRWADLEPGDFASWLTVPETASLQVQLDVWYEDKGRWKRLPNVGGVIDLRHLVPVPANGVLPPNTIEWTFSSQPGRKFYLPEVSLDDKPLDEKNVVERSLRETRMKKGASVSGLHQ